MKFVLQGRQCRLVFSHGANVDVLRDGRYRLCTAVSVHHLTAEGTWKRWQETPIAGVILHPKDRENRLVARKAAVAKLCKLWLPSRKDRAVVWTAFFNAQPKCAAWRDQVTEIWFPLMHAAGFDPVAK